jgi:hypothetical protein
MRGLVEVEAMAPRAAGAFLFLLPGGRPWRRDDEGAAATAGAAFLPLPFGWPGPRFSGTPTSPGALVAWGKTDVEGVAVAVAARASKVFLLWLPFGRPRFRDVGGDISGALSSFSPSVGTLSPLATEPLGDDMIGLGLGRRGSR